MAETSCKCFLFSVFILFCCSGTVVSSSYEPRIKTDYPSIFNALSTFLQDKAFPSQFHILVCDRGVVVDSLTNKGESAKTQSVNQYLCRRSYEAILISGSKPHLRSHFSKLEFSSVIVKGNELQILLPVLRSTNSLLKGLNLEKAVKVSVALPLSLLTSLSMKQRKHLDDILNFIRETHSFMIVEDYVGGKWNKADVPNILSSRNSVSHSVIELSALNRRSLQKYPEIDSTLASMLLEVSPTHRLRHMLSSRRELLTSFGHKAIQHDTLFPPATPITNPATPVTNPTTPSTITPYNPTPTIVTIPGTGPPPSSVGLPYINPVPLTSPVSVTPTAPITSPVTNPVTTYPPPSTIGGVPSSTSPVTTAPVTTAPVIPGQTWCIARSGAAETALQSALDYACGIGGADCSTIQEGSSCYNPNTLENHASYAFNSYFQKNPGSTSCDFGGTAVLVNTNPSSGVCIYPSSATTATPSTISPVTTDAPSTIPPATTSSTSGPTGTESSYGSPPLVLNTSSDPTPGSSTAYGYGTPISPIVTAPPSGLNGVAGVQPFYGFVLLTTAVAMTVLLGV